MPGERRELCIWFGLMYESVSRELFSGVPTSVTSVRGADECGGVSSFAFLRDMPGAEHVNLLDVAVQYSGLGLSVYLRSYVPGRCRGGCFVVFPR